MEAIDLPRAGGIREALQYLSSPVTGSLPDSYQVLWCRPSGLLGLGREWPEGTMPLLVARGAALQVVLDNAAEVDAEDQYWIPQMPEDDQALLRFRDAGILVLLMVGQNDLGWRLSPLGEESLAILEQRSGKLPQMHMPGVQAETMPAADDQDEEPHPADLRWAVVLAPMPDQAMAERIVAHCRENVKLSDYTVLDVIEQTPAVEFRFRREGDARVFRLKFGGELRPASPLPATSGDGWPQGLLPVILARQEDGGIDIDGDDLEAEQGMSLRVEDAGSITAWHLVWQVELSPAPTPAELVQIAEHLVEVEQVDYAAILSDQAGALPAIYRFRDEDQATQFADVFGSEIRDLRPADPRQGQLFAA